MKYLLLLLLLTTIAVCPNPEKDYRAEWIAVSNGTLIVNGKIWNVSNNTIITKNKTSFLKEFNSLQFIGNLSNYKIVEGITLPNKGAKIVFRNKFCTTLYYKNAKKGEIFYWKNGWHVWYEDWTNFKPVTVNTTYTIVQSPSNLDFRAKNAIVVSYTYTYPCVKAENVTYFLEERPIGGVPSKELKLKNVHFLRGTYRFFHYKFAVLWNKSNFSNSTSIITTENWKWCNRGYYVIIKDSRVSEFLLRVVNHDKIYEKQSAKYNRKTYQMHFNTHLKPRNEIKKFRGKITVFVLPDFNPILNAISSAKNRLYIEAPYIVPYPSLVNAIKKASKKTKVLIVLSKIGYARELERIPNVSIRIFPQIHGKLIISDKKAIITSANLDKCGLEMNREAGVVVYGNVSDWLAEKFMHDYNYGMENFKIKRIKFFILIIIFGFILSFIFLSYKVLLPRRKK